MKKKYQVIEEEIEVDGMSFLISYGRNSKYPYVNFIDWEVSTCLSDMEHSERYNKDKISGALSRSKWKGWVPEDETKRNEFIDILYEKMKDNLQEIGVKI